MSTAIQNPPTKLCANLTVDLNGAVSSHNRKGTMYRVAAILSAVALVAIFTAMTSVYLGLIASPPVWALIVGIFTALAATKGLAFWKKGGEQFAEAASIKEITNKMTEIEGWGTDQITQYFADRNLNLGLLTESPDRMALLEEKSPGQPLKALLPLIARELALEKETAILKRREINHIGGLNIPENRPALEAGAELGPITEEPEEDVSGFNKYHQTPELEYAYFVKGVESREKLSFNLFQRAVLLQNLLQPETNFAFDQVSVSQIDLWQEGSAIQGPIGNCVMKGVEGRAIEYSSILLSGIDRPRNFYFSTTPGKEPITTDHISELQAHQLRAEMFD